MEISTDEGVATETSADGEGFVEGQGQGLRTKSSLRIQYEAQVRVIRGQIGGLEQVREGLGLSQRKMAQLLLVDPSAWTRWTRAGEDAPPHIWRALQWYSALVDRLPGLTPAYFLGADPKFSRERTLQMVEEQLRIERSERERMMGTLESRIRGLEDNARLWRRRFFAAMGGVLLLALLFATGRARAEVEDGAKDHRWIPIFYYTPETKLAAGGLAILPFGPERDGRTSQLTGVASVTANGQYMVNLSPRYFSASGRGETSGIFSYRYFPSRYFGRGETTSPEENGEKYAERGIDLALQQSFEVKDPVVTRWGLSYGEREIQDSMPGGLVELETMNFGKKLKTLGLTASLEWDERETPQSPRSGSWHRLIGTRFQPRNESSGRELSPVDRLEVDLRWYRPRRQGLVTWAHQAYLGEVSGPEIPFQYLQSVGGGSRLRGFYAGRFRDQALVMLQSEWRYEIRDRWTATVGAGVGRLAAESRELRDARDLWSGALGVQYLMSRKSRTKLRADLGFGHRPSFYILMGEAF